MMDPMKTGIQPENNGQDMAPETTPIATPDTSVLDKFKSKRTGQPGIVSKPEELEIRRIGELKDFCKLSPHEEHWSEPYCFVTVPVDGQKDGLEHLITDDMADKYLEEKQFKRYRLALASMPPKGSFFLMKVPVDNLENAFNKSALEACIDAKSRWTMATAQKEKNRERYRIKHAGHEDFAPEPEWSSQPAVDHLILARYKDLLIETPEHPGLRRLGGLRQEL
jgi:hypothetical protein